MQQLRILIIEDNKEAREVLTLWCRNIQGLQCDVVEADRFEAGMGILRGNGIDAVILDLGLPDSFGLDSVEGIRSISTTVVIMVLTGIGKIEDGIKAMRLGADDYWTKPLHDPTRLLWSTAFAVARRRDARKTETWWRDKKLVALIGALTALAGALAKLLGIWGH